MEKIRILYLINDLYINNFEYLYRLIEDSDLFEMTVLACDSVATDYKNRTSSAKVCDYVSGIGIRCIDAYDYDKKEWIDLDQFDPDYIFVSDPYDIYRPEKYDSLHLSSIARLCTIEYGAIIIRDDESFIASNPFYKYCSYVFINDQDEMSFCDRDQIADIYDKFVPVGCTKTDKYIYQNDKKKNWDDLFETRKNHLKVVWKPRWAFDDVVKLLEDVQKVIRKAEENALQILLIEHPLLRSRIESFGDAYIRDFVDLLDGSDGTVKSYDGADYLDYVLDGDVLIGEYTSLMSEFTVCGRPILLIGDYEKLNDYGKRIISKENVFDDYDELLERLVHQKTDPKRKPVNRAFFQPPGNQSSSEYLLSILEKDSTGLKGYFRRLYTGSLDELLKIREILLQGAHEEILDRNIPYMNDIGNGLQSWKQRMEKLKEDGTLRGICRRIRKKILKMLGSGPDSR